MSTNKYQHLFFDLDRTLWDFDRNSKEAILALYQQHELKRSLGVSFDDFFSVYRQKNDDLWALYRKGKVKKDELRALRFHNSFRYFGLDDAKLGLQFNNEYVAQSSSKKNLVDGAEELLKYLSSKYQLHLITNGFVEAQNRKLDNCNIRKYFKAVVISDGLGFKKPDRRIFIHAMELAKSDAGNSLMIGDDYGPDVLGAKDVGIDQVFFNRNNKLKSDATYTINKLLEMKEFL